MIELGRTGQFKKDYKLALKRGKKLEALPEIVEALSRGDSPATKYRPHRLSGDWSGYWECHLEPDYLMIYTVSVDEVMLVRLGTHADLF
jgi:mRNA interferase YafQ